MKMKTETKWERSERSEGVAKNLDPFHVAKDGLT